MPEYHASAFDFILTDAKVSLNKEFHGIIIKTVTLAFVLLTVSMVSSTWNFMKLSLSLFIITCQLNEFADVSQY